ncbi:nucleotidyltransferase family protein [Bradyrhizobium sp. BRP56]|uniref:nucleotidyltransferase family protein n=1 Tax=Bradyrhizobium sp. BRP56 TaxID=2793819 RepID=UPI001CD32FE8|nr:nucleotidyltransferase family protein [Bradyrhizobium sp. BRP56]
MTQDEFLAAALRNPANQAITDELYRLGLPDAWLVAGCLVQTVWNVLTSRPLDHGISDHVAGMIVRPNRTANFSPANYATKAARWKALWPEITVLAAE